MKLILLFYPICCPAIVGVVTHGSGLKHIIYYYNLRSTDPCCYQQEQGNFSVCSRDLGKSRQKTRPLARVRACNLNCCLFCG